MIAPLNAVLRIADRTGTLTRDFKRWLDHIAISISSTYVADKAPQRSFVIKTGQFGVHVDELILHGTESVTLEGDAVMVILG